MATREPHPEERLNRDQWRARLDRISHSLDVRAEKGSEVSDCRGQPLQMLDLGIDGEIDGWVLIGGFFDQLAEDHYSWLLDTDVAVAQEALLHHVQASPGEPLSLPMRVQGWHGRAEWAMGKFYAAKGAGLRLILPPSERWNRRLAVLTSGTGIYRDLACRYVGKSDLRPGQLVPRDPATGFAEGLGANLYAELLVDRGYGVAWLRKDEVRPPDGTNHAQSGSGMTLRVSHHSNVAYTLALIEFAQSWLQQRVGAPERTYLYGHSSGGMTARLINLRPEANVAPDGGTIVDGVLADDVGGGMYLPTLLDNGGQETVLADEEAQARFVPEIDVSRVLYRPETYLPIKRLFGESLREHGLGERHRHYEVAAVSHFDAGMAGTGGSPDNLDLGGLFGALWDALDAWVTEGREPPASHERDQAISLPEEACPCGVRSAPGGGPFTEFSPFDGSDDARGETMTVAWQRRGLLGAAEEFDREKFKSCLVASAESLRSERLFSPEAASWTVANAEVLYERSRARL